jgi:hypothetical protein
MPVGEMLQRMSSLEITEWMAYFKLLEEPEAPQEKPKASDVLRSMYATKIVRKENG